ncbi:MAG: DUF2520 domain-containing protein [Acidimicrobiales bacterium]|nr:DUF2520 domain-containing protein [Acidimicrobiales bacterium]
MPTVRIIGPGRAGRSFGNALQAVGWGVAGYLGRDDDPHDAARGVDLLLVATPDAAIATVASRVAPVGPEGAVVAHLSGSLGVDVLMPHARRAAIHPLVALPNPEVGAQRLGSGAWFAVEGDPIVQEVVEQLGGRWFEIAGAHRAHYHAAACIASNHLVALLGQVERIAQRAGIPWDGYLDLVRATVENVARLGPAGALTGPAARGDWATIERHRKALDEMDPNEREVYDALVRAVRRLAEGAWPPT